MKIILFGATGMVGMGVLREALDAPEVESVLSIGRSSCGVTHPKLRELVDAAREAGGGLVEHLEQEIVSLVAGALVDAGVAAAWKPLGVTAKQLAEHLFATANGIKDAVATRSAYRTRMRTAFRIVVHGGPETGRGKR
jgi:hypothetical protein